MAARPRDTRIDRDLIDAWLELIEERDYEDITMEAIAARAGVGKPALYRRFPTKAHLSFTASVATSAPPGIPDLGDVRAELLLCVSELAESTRRVPRPVFAEQIGAMIADPAFAAQVAAVHAPADRQVADVLRRAVDRGEVSPDVDLQLAVADLGGTLLFHILVRHMEADEAYLEVLVDRFLDGIRTRPDRRDA